MRSLRLVSLLMLAGGLASGCGDGDTLGTNGATGGGHSGTGGLSPDHGGEGSGTSGAGADCATGALGCPCYGNDTCDAPLRCEDGVCEACEVGALGCSCYGNATCDEGLTCQSDLCAPDGAGGNGGAPAGSGGVPPTGGAVAGGSDEAGGEPTTGGGAAAGTEIGGSESGGLEQGGSDLGGVETGGVETGGAATGGVLTGGMAGAPAAGGVGGKSEGGTGNEGGATACDEGFIDCDDDGVCEVNPLDDPDACGGCGIRCTDDHGTAVCADGACDSLCDDGFEDCPGSADYRCETDVTSSVANCGECGNACPTDGGTPWCQDSECGFTACAAGTGDCDGDGICETDLHTSDEHCGTCGNACPPQDGTGACAAGTCEIVDCDDGFVDCDGRYDTGCETSLGTPTDCGACDDDCTAIHMTACTNGQCRTCASGYRDCSNAAGCETNITEDPNCGACGNDCSGSTPRCDAGTCEASLIANGDFESNTNGWSSWSGTVGRSNARAHSGSWSLTVSGSSVGVAATDLQSVVQLGQVYEFSFWVYLSGAESAAVHVNGGIACGGDVTYSWLNDPSVTLTAGTWVELSGTLDLSASSDSVPDGCTSLTLVRLFVEDEDEELVNPSGTVVLYVDDVTLGQ